MDGHRFDNWARRLAVHSSRRGVLRGLLVGAAGALGLAGGRGAGAIACRSVGDLCRENANCCSGLCARDAFGRHTCQCPASTVACGRLCVDPATAYQSDPNNCGSCGNRCPAAQCQQPTCTAGVCGLAPNPAASGTPCDDGDLCTTGDVCQSDGSCAGTQVDCSDLTDQCNTGVCNPDTGGCEPQAANEGQTCDDGDACTTGETCTAGVCGTAVVCTALDECHVAGTCDSSTGCSNPQAPNGTTCTDGNPLCLNGACCSGDHELVNGGCFQITTTSGSTCPGCPSCTCAGSIDGSANYLCIGGVVGSCQSNADCAVGQACGLTIGFCYTTC